jgi:hypothetical protein
VSPSFAADPKEALSLRAEDTIYLTARVNDLSGFAKSVISPAMVDALLSAGKMDENAKSGFRLIQTLASQIPAKETAIAAGFGASGPFVQFAASLDDGSPELLSRVAGGSASPEEVSEALLGKVGVVLASMLSPQLQEDEFPYYALAGGALALSARDNLVLIALSPKDLSDSITALGNPGSRLAPRRRFESGDYLFAHVHMALAASLAESASKEGADSSAIQAEFKAPLELEIAFDRKPDSFLVSFGANIMEAMPSLEVFKDLKPAPGGNAFLAGGGSPFLALSGPVSFDTERLAVSPAAAEGWKKIVAMLAPTGITEDDLQNLFSGVITIAAGNEASVYGLGVPGVYLAIQGKDGAASTILDKVFNNEKFALPLPFEPFESEGWNLYALNQSVLPVSVAAGVKGDTLFVGLAEPGRLNDKPAISERGEAVLVESYIGGGFFDADTLWNRLRTESADQASMLGITLANQPSFAELVKEVLSADIAVNFAKLWAPNLDTSFMEFSLADVPPEKALIPTAAKAYSKFVASGKSETVTTETTETTTGMAKAAEYNLDGDTFPGVYGVVGEREVVDSQAGEEGGTPYFAVTYKTDDIVSDVDAYLGKLVDDENWAITQNGLENGYPAGSFITAMKESKDAGKVIVMTVQCGDGVFKLNIAKAEGTLTNIKGLG